MEQELYKELNKQEYAECHRENNEPFNARDQDFFQGLFRNKYSLLSDKYLIVRVASPIIQVRKNNDSYYFIRINKRGHRYFKCDDLDGCKEWVDAIL
jgi:hypothetical protein